MLGLFGTLNMAARSLQAQMTGVEVSGQNLANANNAAYSRQRVLLQANPDIASGVGPEGTGVNAVSIQQVVDSLLSGRILNQTSASSYWDQIQSTLDTAQSSLNEFLDSAQSASGSSATSSSSSSSGLSGQLSAFFNAMQSLSASPSSLDARQALISAAQSLATSFKQINSGLGDLQSSLNDSMYTQVDSANQLLSDIASLNDQIANAENYSGGSANDLRDLREQKLEDLSKYFNFQSSEAADGTVNVSFGSVTFVSGNKVTDKLMVDKSANAPTPTGDAQVWNSDGTVPLTGVSTGFTGGSLAATEDVRDGALATLQSAIKKLSSNLITQVNTIHGAGYSLATSGGTSSTGANFFTGTDSSDIGVNQALVDDPRLIQASSAAGENANGSVALSLAQLASAAQTGLNNATFSDAYGLAVSKLGSALADANNQVTSQTAISSMLSNQRSSVSGVNLDEEMTNLMTYQRAYEASAHLVTTVDQMIQTILAMKST